MLNLQLESEIRQAPEVLGRQEFSLTPPIEELVARLKQKPPNVVVTCARGSSGHAGVFAKHLFERYLGVPVAAAAPSIASIYKGQLALKDQLFLAISQSGRSDDLLEMTKSAKRSGAVTAAVVNASESPLTSVCDFVLPIGAGPELSVAATKTFVATLAALLRLTAAWTGSRNLRGALDRLPVRLSEAANLDWTSAIGTLARAPSLVTIGRGPTFAIAREAALKLKETCNLHAEAFSGAEFLHGPVALVSSRYPILMFVPSDAAAEGMLNLAIDLRKKGTALFAAGMGAGKSGTLPVLPADQPEADAICLIQSFYIMAVALANKLGMDAGRPRHLSKVTRTR
ncbi:MAG: SIS domain-containing protein [Rhodomicrobium sp.]